MRKKTWITCHLSQLDTTKCLVYFLSCLPPHKLWVAWPVEEMSRDRKEIEMGPPGLSGTLEQSPSNWDPRLLGTLQVWPAGTQIVAVRYWAWPGSSSVSGPSHTWVPAILGNNALSSLKPFQLTFSLPSHQLKNYSWYNLACWGAFCLCNVLEPFCQCIYFACYFNQVHECPAIWTDCQRGGNDTKSPTLRALPNPAFWVICVCNKYTGNVSGEKWKYMWSKSTRWKHILVAVLMYVCHGTSSVKVEQVLLLSISLKAALACKHQFPPGFWTEWIKPWSVHIFYRWKKKKAAERRHRVLGQSELSSGCPHLLQMQRKKICREATQGSRLLHSEAPWIMGSRPQWLQYCNSTASECTFATILHQSAILQ